MDKKKIITIVSIVVTILIIAIATVLVLHQNNETVKATVAQNNMKENEILNTDNPEDMPTDEVTAEPTEESATPSTKPSTKPIVKNYPYYIKVNTQMNTVTIYTKDSSGNYTVPVKAMVCSTGYKTPKNAKFQTKGKWTWGIMFGGVFTQWETHITGDYLFHSVPYLKKYDPSTLEYWEYDKLGTTCSAGCVRLTVADALWIYNNCPIGTTVEFYSSSNPGPLGKPTAQKISGNVECRGWDPTDPDPNNPWRNQTTPEPTVPPTIEPSPAVTPSVVPEESPTEEPTPTKTPTATPTQTPTATPTESSKETPSPEQTGEPKD